MQTLDVVGKNVKRYRKEMGISQEELGDKAGIHRTFIGAIERGDRNISLLTLSKVASALDVPIYKLLEE